MKFTFNMESDLHYVCSLLVYIAQETNNYISDIIKLVPKKELTKQLKFAHINHCLAIEEVVEDIVGKLNIPNGNFYGLGKEFEYVTLGDVYKAFVISYYLNYRHKLNLELEDALYNVLSSPISKTVDQLSFGDIKS